MDKEDWSRGWDSGFQSGLDRVTNAIMEWAEKGGELKSLPEFLIDSVKEQRVPYFSSKTIH